jgi:hypothetical protein
MNEIQNYSFICQTDKFISIKNRNDESKKDNFFFVFYYRCDSYATKDFTRFHWIIHEHVIHELYCFLYSGVDSFLLWGGGPRIFVQLRPLKTQTL